MALSNDGMSGGQEESEDDGWHFDAVVDEAAVDRRGFGSYVEEVVCDSGSEAGCEVKVEQLVKLAEGVGEHGCEEWSTDGAQPLRDLESGWAEMTRGRFSLRIFAPSPEAADAIAAALPGARRPRSRLRRGKNVVLLDEPKLEICEELLAELEHWDISIKKDVDVFFSVVSSADTNIVVVPEAVTQIANRTGTKVLFSFTVTG